LEDRVLRAVVPRLETAANGVRSFNERIRQIIEGRRQLGQRVMEIVFLSREPLSPADANRIWEP
jgi:hypothetical protein